MTLECSPYDPIPTGPYPPIFEFVTEKWKSLPENKLAIVDISTGTERTYQQIYSTIGKLAATLKEEMGVGPGTCVAMFCPNHVDYLAASLAVPMTGAMLTPINPLFTTKELTDMLSLSQSTCIIVHENVLDTALEAAQKCQQTIEHIIVLQNDNGQSVPEGTVSLDSIRKHDKEFLQTVDSVHGQTERSVSFLPYSSGTTGTPKGVALTHANIVSNLHQVNRIEGPFYGENTTLISPLPFFHIYAFVVSLLFHSWKGGTLITNSARFDLPQFCKAIEDYKVQRGHLVPPIILGLAKHPIVDNYDFSSLEGMISAAAPLGSDTEKQAVDRLGCKIKQCYGMSELSPLATGHMDTNIKSGSVGPVCASSEGKIVDQQGNSLGPHETGELLIRGPQVMKEYLEAPEKTKETRSDSGWLRTGDVAYYDEDGYVFITDRLKELIKVRGFPVAPAELEALLLTHEAVADAAVIGVKDDESGEVPKAFVVLRQEVSPTAIQEWVKEQVVPYKRLEGGVNVVEQIPKSASGKILRRMLKQ